jgi:DNA-binding transcriptional LysR family regulator
MLPMLQMFLSDERLNESAACCSKSRYYLVEIRHLRVAVVTAETRSFSRAAKLPHVKQSALCRRVPALEQIVGVQLFERTKRRPFATNYGKAFLTVAERVLSDINNFLPTAKNVSYGE